MKVFRRSAAARRRGGPSRQADLGVSSVVVVTDEVAAASRAAERAAAWAALRRIVAEAVILQDQAEELLADLRDRRDLAAIAPPTGRIMSRYVALRHALPACGDPEMDRHTAVLRTIFDHHMYMLNSARALLAAEWRSERLTAQLDRIDGLGPPAARLDRVRTEILAARR
jgi:hypothetical protein